MEQLYQKHVRISSADIDIANLVLARYDIAMAYDEILLIHGWSYIVKQSGLDEDVDLYAVLFQKQADADGEYAGTAFGYADAATFPDFEKDNDVLDISYVGKNTVAVGGSWGVNRDRVWYPIPLVVPRSPSFFLFNNSNGTLTVRSYSTLYYTKKKVSKGELMRYLKRYVGRKQNPVPNEPPHTGEDDPQGA